MNKDIIESEKSAVVVGASLAGLMMGIGLVQAGLNVTILERVGPEQRRDAVLQVDSGEQDFSNTVRLLRKLASGGLRWL